MWDTRKTTPGLRSLEKAVRAGGARNHRGNLSDWVMFKDNHLTALGIVEAVRSAGTGGPAALHVECERIDQVIEALDAGAGASSCSTTCRPRRPAPPSSSPRSTPQPTAPGGRCSRSPAASPSRPWAPTASGADVVSSGSLTNSSPVLDIGLDIDVH